MTAPRFFVDDAASGLGVVLSESDSHHARTVLRMREGDDVVLVDQEGREFAGRLRHADEGRLQVTVLEQLPVRARTPHVVLFQCIGKARKMDRVVRQATELGAAAIVPVVSERTIVRVSGEKGSGRLGRWRRIAEESAKQSRRRDVPEVRDPVSLEAAVEEIGSLDGALALWEEAGGEALASAVGALTLGPVARIGVLVGPEGGLSDAEAALLRGSGLRLVSLGRQILRTETAAVVALALTLHELGGLAPDDGAPDG